jgi:hypothetical protein
VRRPRKIARPGGGAAASAQWRASGCAPATDDNLADLGPLFAGAAPPTGEPVPAAPPGEHDDGWASS